MKENLRDAVFTLCQNKNERCINQIKHFKLLNIHFKQETKKERERNEGRKKEKENG